VNLPFFAWEQRKLNRLVTPVVREVPKPDEAYERISVRSHAKGTFHQKVDDPKAVSMDKLYVVKENDLIVNITFAWEHAIAVASKKDDGLLVSHRFPTFIIDNSDINFIHYSVTQESFRKKMELISPGGAGRNRVLNKKDFVNLKIDVPIQIEEQSKIGKFLKQLDDTIALYQKKQDKLKRLKSAYLDQIFSQRIWFFGYSEKWEQTKLKYLSKYTYGGGTPKTSVPAYWTGTTPWIQSSDLKKDNLSNVKATKFITEKAVNESATKLIPKDSIAIVTRVGVGKLAYMPYSYTTSQDFLSLTGLKVDAWFGVYSVYSLLKKEDNIQGTSIKGVKKNDLLEKEIKIPRVVTEQQKIGKFLKQIDITIDLYQAKINKLNQIKQGFLQKMFI
jgi:type I restriction enzyme, S subunit